MLELTTLSGKNIDLTNNQVTIELFNSLFNDGSQFRGSTSYPIDVAFTDNNKSTFGYANALETGIKAHKIPVHAKIGGQSFRNCVLALTVGEKKFDSNLQIDLGEINEYISKTSIKNVFYPLMYLGYTQPDIQNNIGLAAANLNWRNIPYTFIPVRNNKFTGGSAVKPTLNPIPSGDLNQPITPPTGYGKKYTLINSMHLESNALKFDVQLSVQPQGLYHTIPYFYLPYVLESIATHLRFKLKGDFILHPDIEKLLIYNNNDVFITRHNNTGYIEEEKRGIVFSAADHLPDITISELFKSLCAYFCIRITINSKGEMICSFKKSVFDNPKYQDWSEKLVKIAKQEFEISGGFTLTAETDPLDIDKEAIKDTVTIGQGKEKIEIKAGALRTITEVFPNQEFSWTIVSDNRSGNILDPIFKDLENYRSVNSLTSFPLRFIFAKGLVPNSNNSLNYPTGSPFGTDIDLNLNSIYQKLMKPWLDRTFGSKRVKAIFLLTPEDICTINDDNIILLKDENGSTSLAIFETITFTSGADQVIKAEADLIILDSANIDNTSPTGVYVKITEENSTYSEFSIPKYGIPVNVTRSLLLEQKQTLVDLKVELFEDKYGTIPLTNKEVVMYIDVKIVDNRTTNTMSFNDVTDTFHEASEFQEVRKIVTQNSSITIPGVVKKLYQKWWVTTPSTISNDLYINRENHYSIQVSPNYAII